MKEEQQVQRGFLADADVQSQSKLIVTFQFNPQSITDNREVHYADLQTSLSQDTPGKIYTGGGDRTITFDIQLHGTESGLDDKNQTPEDNGVTRALATLRSFLYPKTDAWAAAPKGEAGRRVTSPPICFFGFGTRIFECVVAGMEITETQFNSRLAPVRAEVRITLKVNEEKENTADRVLGDFVITSGDQNTRLS